MIRERTLYAVRVDGRWKIPVHQFGHDGLVPNIGAVNAAVPNTLDAVSVLRWFTTPDPELEAPDGKALTPLDWLKAGLDPAPGADGGPAIRVTELGAWILRCLPRNRRASLSVIDARQPTGDGLDGSRRGGRRHAGTPHACCAGSGSGRGPGAGGCSWCYRVATRYAIPAKGSLVSDVSELLRSLDAVRFGRGSGPLPAAVPANPERAARGCAGRCGAAGAAPAARRPARGSRPR